MRDSHDQLFTDSSQTPRHGIKRITGVEVREAAVEVETATGIVAHAFTSGTMVQVFLPAENVSGEGWARMEPDCYP